MIDLEHVIETVVRRVLREELAHHARPSGLVSIKVYAKQNGVSESLVRQGIREDRMQPPAERMGRAVRVAIDAQIRPRRAPAESVGDRADRILRVVKGGQR